MNVGVNVGVFRDDKLLLTRRQDFGVWCLPGGHVDEGESVAQAAIREMAEETGLEIQLRQLVGLYSIPETRAWVNLIILFEAKAVGGALQAQDHEVQAIDYFSAGDIPQNLLWGHRQRIDDLWANASGVVWRQYVPFASEIDRQALYRLQENSGLSGEVFYERYFGWETPQADRQEIE